MLRAMPSLPDWGLRPAADHDVPVLAALYADTARCLGPWCYTPQQVNAWASFGADTPAFREYVLGADTWVIEQRGSRELLGFCGVDAQGELRSFYVRADCTRQGLGSSMLQHVLRQAELRGLVRLHVWATPFSRPVFERFGFVLEQVVREPYQGVPFDRLRMCRR